jgi:hypothetical protein
MRISGDESGISKLKVLIVLAVLGLGLNEGIKYLSVQLDYQRMKDAMNTKAAAAQVLKDDEILADLEAKSKELDLPLRREHFQIVRNEEKRRVTIKTAWEEEVLYLWGVCGDLCTQKYRFEVVADEAYSGR